MHLVPQRLHALDVEPLGRLGNGEVLVRRPGEQLVEFTLLGGWR